MKKIKNEKKEILSGTVKAGPREDFAGKVNEDKPAAEPTREQILEAALVLAIGNVAEVKCFTCCLLPECLERESLNRKPEYCKESAILAGERVLKDALNGEGPMRELAQNIFKTAGCEHLYKDKQ